MTIDFEALSAPFAPTDLDWRVGSKSKKGDKATLLVYLTSRAVQSRLDEVVGPARWRDAYTPLFEGGKITGYLCELSVEVEPGKWIPKVDGADLTDIEAIKGGLSSALKRAAVKYGIGRYLYDVDSKWHTIREGYGPDDVSVYCPMGPDKLGPPGHILIPKLPEWAQPKPKKPKNGTPIDTTPTPEDQRLADEIAAEKAAREAADKARRDAHHESWEKDQRDFCGAVGSKLNLNVDLAMDLAERTDPWRKRPSAMSREDRVAYYRWLQTPEGALAYDGLVAERERGAA